MTRNTHRRNTRCKVHRNRTMSDETYKLRRAVIDCIYSAKRLVPSLPRIEVRISERARDSILGSARMGDCVLWIREDTVTDRADLKGIVYHEIVHAAFNIGHIDDCPLMTPCAQPMTSAVLDKAFLKYAAQAGFNTVRG